jgi:hypothetical protein
MLATLLLGLTAVIGVSALAFAEDTTVIEKRTEEHQAVEVAPAPRERVIEERTVTQPPAVQKRTDTVVKTTKDNDNDDNDND